MSTPIVITTTVKAPSTDPTRNLFILRRSANRSRVLPVNVGRRGPRRASAPLSAPVALRLTGGLLRRLGGRVDRQSGQRAAPPVRRRRGGRADRRNRREGRRAEADARIPRTPEVRRRHRGRRRGPDQLAAARLPAPLRRAAVATGLCERDVRPCEGRLRRAAVAPVLALL